MDRRKSWTQKKGTYKYEHKQIEGSSRNTTAEARPFFVETSLRYATVVELFVPHLQISFAG